MIFLSEAFTKPTMMHTLGKIGFHQSYTYFTWRNDKPGIEEYLTELSHYILGVPAPQLLREHARHPARVPPVRRPGGLQDQGDPRRDGSPSWGVYAGFELFEHVAVRPGSEEYLDSEKYQLRVRDWSSEFSLAPYLTLLNKMRNEHPALQLLRNLQVHASDDAAITCFSKARTATTHGHRRRQRGPARGARDHGAPEHAGPRHGLGRPASSCTTR